jgi:S-disulfanyl-L-cysteine oxidoreductase SoxD
MSKFPELLAATALAACLAAPALAQPLGLGRTALPAEIAAWDVAVLPDGTGLRPGRGNVLDGEDLWVDHCAACHGDFGEGAGAWPVIAGGEGTLTRERPLKTVGSYWPYLSTVYDYVHRSMPFGNAQTLSVDDTYAIVAYILYANGLVDDDFELSDANFTEVALPNVDGFYVDDRDAVEVPLFTQEPCMTNCREAPQVTFRATTLNVTPIQLPPARIAGLDAPAPVVTASAQVEPTPEATPEATPEPTPEPEAETVILTAADPALVAEGERAFRQCATCHRVGEGARNGTGPQLNGVFGAQAGTRDGFRYSPQMTGAGGDGLVWTAESLDAFLENPAGLIPRNRMSFRGVRSAEERAALIAYLSTFAD